MRKLKNWTLVIATLFITSCGQDGLELRSDRGQGGNFTSAGIDSDAAGGCGCKLEFNPVCGEDHRTYDSACVANCMNVPYTFGACDNNGKLNCSSIVQYVCAQPPMPTCDSNVACPQVMPAAKAYLNLCHMIEAKAQFINIGVCK